MKTRNLLFLCLLAASTALSAQITDRQRPAEWSKLVEGGRFMDRFLPMPQGKLSSDTWGAPEVLPRYIDNGIEDRKFSYWGGNILRGDDGKYHFFVCGWLESSPRGHHEWSNSIVYHAVCDNPIGPFTVKDTIGRGHNPEAFRLHDGRYVIYVIDGRYVGQTINGPWEYGHLEFNTRNRSRRIIEDGSNLTFARREDGSFLMISRTGGVWFSETGLSPYNQVTDHSVYPPVEGSFEDPVVWRDHIQYHLIVNDWYGRIAYYLRSKDGVKWVVDPGEAYQPGIARHEDGSEEKWFKYERMKVCQDAYGRAIQANFAVIDVLKNDDRGSDNHSSKNISIPLNPGLLLSIIDKKAITPTTTTIRVKIAAEKGFDPQKDLDLSSLRFGASTKVNFGQGLKAKSSEKSGADLIVVFEGADHGITADEFATKLIGRSRHGKMVYGYARLPEVDYIEPILSAMAPIFTPRADGTDVSVEVQNFGQVASEAASLELTAEIDGKNVKIGSAAVKALEPFEKTTVFFRSTEKFELSMEYQFSLNISLKGKVVSTFRFKAKVAAG